MFSIINFFLFKLIFITNFHINQKKILFLIGNLFDILDFNLLMVNWGNINSGNVADVNKDNKVDLLDFNMLMVYWAQ